MRKHLGKVGFVVAIILAFVVPAAALSSTAVLNGGDTLAVSCNGARLDDAQVDATHRNLSCVANTTTTSTTSTTLPTTTAPAGNFTDGFASLANWTFAHWTSAPVTDGAYGTMNSSASISNGQAKIVTADQNYGDATLRSNTKYSLGEIRLMISDDGGGNNQIGSAYVGLTTDPYNAPAIKRDNGEGPTPANGILIQLRDNCRVPWGGPQGSVYVNHVETVTTSTCLLNQNSSNGAPVGPVQMRVTNGHVEFWTNGVKYAEMNVATPASGYFMLGVHNHASLKYSNNSIPAVTGLFDDVSYPAAGSVTSYRNGQGVAVTGTSARVLFTGHAATVPNTATIAVNGHSHSFAPYSSLSHSVSESVVIPSSDLVVGNNAIVIDGAFVPTGNVDLVVENGGSPATTTTGSTTSTSSTTTRPSTTTSTTTTRPTTTTGSTTTTAPTGNGIFYSNTFDTAADMARLRVERLKSPNTDVTFQADHDAACGNPFTYRTLNEQGPLNPSDPNSILYFCNQHFMTAINTINYSDIPMTPTQNGQTIIFPATANRFCWDQSEAQLSPRKWTELAVVSDDHYNANGGGIGYWNPIFNGNAVSGSILLSDDDFMFQSVRAIYFKGQDQTYQDYTVSPRSFSDKATRFQNCVTDNNNGTVTFTQKQLDGSTFTRTGPGAFPAGPRVFILIDATYDPDKDTSPTVAQPYTQHWDSIVVSNSNAIVPASFTVPASYAVPSLDAMMYCAL